MVRHLSLLFNIHKYNKTKLTTAEIFAILIRFMFVNTPTCKAYVCNFIIWIIILLLNNDTQCAQCGLTFNILHVVGCYDHNVFNAYNMYALTTIYDNIPVNLIKAYTHLH